MSSFPHLYIEVPVTRGSSEIQTVNIMATLPEGRVCIASVFRMQQDVVIEMKRPMTVQAEAMQEMLERANMFFEPRDAELVSMDRTA